jgi:hypothetical protein
MLKSRRTVLGIILGVVIAAGLPAPRAAGAEKDIELAVRVFRIPNEQSFEALFLDRQGRPVPFQARGDVTASFPRATIFFRTELAANASEDAVRDAIADRVSFGGYGISIRKVRIDELKSVGLTFDQGHPTAEARFEESRGDGRSLNFEVRAELLSVEKDKVLVRIRFDAGWSAQGGRLGVGMSEAVISAPFEVPESKILLIGGSASGTVYWLAVAAFPRG